MRPVKRIERAGRRGLSGLLRVVFARHSATLPAEPRSILVVRTDNRLGNLVLMEPLLRSIRERFPEAELVLLLSHVFAELLVSQGYSVITVDKKRQIGRPWEFCKLVLRLRKSSFEVAIDASHPFSFSLSGAVSTAMCGAPSRIGTPSGDWEGWYTAVSGPPDRKCHESRTIHGLGGVWQDWPKWTPPRLEVSGFEKRDAVGLHVGGKPGKAYPREKLRKAVSEITAFSDLEIYWGSDMELLIAEELGGDRITIMPRLDVTGFMRAVAGLRAFVSPDCGPMHIASALGIPVIALFRTDNAERFSPLSEGSAVLSDPDGADPHKVVAALGELSC
jgi:heptosyltransferase-3